MGCKVKTTRHGTLALRLNWGGREWWEGVGLADTRVNRKKVERIARAIDADIRVGGFSGDRYLHYFPHGNRVHEFETARCREPVAAPAPRGPTIAEYAETWLARQRPPLVRASRARDYRQAIPRVLALRVPHHGQLIPVGDLRLADLAPAHLSAAQGHLLDHGLAVKTVRNLLDASFRAMVRDARTVDQLITGDPFVALRWPRTQREIPDPFTEAERDQILEWFRTKRRVYYAFVAVLFHTGMRPSEAVALRWGDVDLGRGTLTISRSRYMGSEATTKTAKSARDIALLKHVVQILRDHKPLHVDADDYVFTNAKNGGPIDQREWPKDHWRAALRATNIRPRKFYATRHTFMSVVLSRGFNLKLLAEYCGTSVAMIEQSYGRFLATGVAAQLALLDDGTSGGSGVAVDERTTGTSPSVSRAGGG